VHVLDAHGAPVGDGETGELCVGGPAVAFGYHNLPELVALRKATGLRLSVKDR
jgi:non-ribosomal peptide synthetase component F